MVLGAESLGIGSNVIKQMFNLAPFFVIAYLRASRKLINLQNFCGHEKAAKVQGRLKVCPHLSCRGCQDWLWLAGLTAPNALHPFCCSRSACTG